MFRIDVQSHSKHDDVIYECLHVQSFFNAIFICVVYSRKILFSHSIVALEDSTIGIKKKVCINTMNALYVHVQRRLYKFEAFIL